LLSESPDPYSDDVVDDDEAASKEALSSMACAYRRLHDPAAEKQTSWVEAVDKGEDVEDDDERNDDASVDLFGVAFQSILNSKSTVVLCE
jgi:hypothetical protein